MRLRLAFACLLALVTTLVPATAADSISISGLDQHDGDLVQVGSTYYLYGTSYGCGWTWMQQGTPWCGFTVRTSSDLKSWSAPAFLFDPGNTDTTSGLSWRQDCEVGGCFEPRMVQRYDGVWILWFIDVSDYAYHAWNGFYAMGCAGPAGPCGAGSRRQLDNPALTTHKPSLFFCGQVGAPAIAVQGQAAYLFCNGENQQFAIERLDRWWTNGSGIGVSYGVGGLSSVESAGPYFDGQHWKMTYSAPNCGYCSGTGTSELISLGDLLGPWVFDRQLSSRSCGGQPNLVVSLNGQPYQWIDQWTGSRNETVAPILLAPPEAIPC